MKINAIYTIFLLILTSQIAQARFLVSLRPEAGVNLANVDMKHNGFWKAKDYETQVKPGGKGGLFCKLSLGKGLFVEPGVFYSVKGFKKTHQDLWWWDPTHVTKATLIITTNGIEVPLNVGYDIKIPKAGSLFVYAGPYLSDIAGGTRKYRNGDKKLTADFPLNVGSDNSGDEIKRMDYGFNAGLGYNAPFGIYLRAQYGYGLANLVPDKSQGYMRTRVFCISFGYNLSMSHWI